MSAQACLRRRLVQTKMRDIFGLTVTQLGNCCIRLSQRFAAWPDPMNQPMAVKRSTYSSFMRPVEWLGMGIRSGLREGLHQHVVPEHFEKVCLWHASPNVLLEHTSIRVAMLGRRRSRGCSTFHAAKLLAYKLAAGMALLLRSYSGWNPAP